MKNWEKEKQASLTPSSLPAHGFVGSSDYFLYFCLFYPATLWDTNGKKALFILVTGKNKNLTATHDQTAAREKGMSEGRRRERETHSSIFHGFALQLDRKERERGEWEKWREFFFPQCRKSGPFFYFRCPRMLTKLHQEGQTEVCFFFQLIPSCSFKVLLLVLNWSSQLSAEFRPRLLTTCDATAITDQPTERRGAHLYKWPGAKNWLTCVCHVKCTVYATYTISVCILDIHNKARWVRFVRLLLVRLWVTQRAGFGGHLSRKSAITERLQQCKKGNTIQLNQLLFINSLNHFASNKNLMY